MVTVSQVQRGFVRFVDNEVASAFEGWQKAIVAGGAGLLAANFPNMVKAYGSSPVVAAMGIYDPATESVNIEALCNAIVPKLGIDKIPIVIPKIGTIKLGREEIEIMVRYIKEA